LQKQVLSGCARYLNCSSQAHRKPSLDFRIKKTVLNTQFERFQVSCKTITVRQASQSGCSTAPKQR